MEQGVRPVLLKQVRHQGSVADITVDKRVVGSAGERDEVPGVPGIGEFIQVHQSAAAAGEVRTEPAVDEVGPNEARTAGDQNGNGLGRRRISQLRRRSFRTANPRDVGFIHTAVTSVADCGARVRRLRRDAQNVWAATGPAAVRPPRRSLRAGHGGKSCRQTSKTPSRESGSSPRPRRR